MFEPRLYTVGLIPVVLAILIGAFSLTHRPGPETSTLAPDAFDGTAAQGILSTLALAAPSRRPGSAGDVATADRVRRALQAPNFVVSTRHVEAQTIDGRQDVETVTSTRVGAVDRRIVVLAHRDAAASGAPAELSGTAALVELGHVLAGRVTNRTIELVSTSGGSGGDAGAADFAAHPGGPIDAVIVLGDLGGTRTRRPQVIGYGDGVQHAPDRLTRTLQWAVGLDVGHGPGGPGASTQFTRLAAPATLSEQGPLLAAGLPAAAVSVSGERGPAAATPVDAMRLQAFGRAVLRAINALDTGPDVAAPAPGNGGADIVLNRLVLPAWVVRLLAAALIVAPLLTAVDGVARARRRRLGVRRSLRLTLSLAAPFLLAGAFAALAGRLGVLGPAPHAPTEALGLDGTGRGALIATLLVLALCLLTRSWVLRALGGPAAPGPETPAVALLVASLTALAAWTVNPFAALVLAIALQLWLLASLAGQGGHRLAPLVLWAAGLVPAGAVAVDLMRQLALDPLEALRMGVALAAGGQAGVVAIALWGLALGCAATLALALGATRAAATEPDVTVFGPMGYAGPGALGGTESALRR